MAVTWKKLAFEDDVITKALIDAKGDIIVGTAADTVGRLAVGTDNYYLKVATDTPAWEALDISDDASPALGGNLACGGYTLTGAGHGIADNQVLTVDDASAANADFARFTSNGIEGITSAAALTALVANALAEGDAIKLDAALSLDGTYNGITRTGTAGATLVFGDLVYLASADTRWELTDANTESATTPLIGICVQAAASDGSATTVLLVGMVRAAAFPSFTVGGAVWLSETTGGVTSTKPTTSGCFVRRVGSAWTADELWFCPDGVWVKHA